MPAPLVQSASSSLSSSGIVRAVQHAAIRFGVYRVLGSFGLPIALVLVVLVLIVPRILRRPPAGARARRATSIHPSPRKNRKTLP